MKRSTTYGIAILAAFSMAMLFGAISASASDFHSETEGTSWSGEPTDNHKFNFPAAGYLFTECDNEFAGQTASTAEDEITVTQSSEEKNKSGYPLMPCKFFGLAFKAAMGTCDYRFHAGGESLVGSMDLTGCGSTRIEFNHSGCSIQIGDQQGLGSVTFKNIGTGSEREIVATANLQSITYTATGAGCFSKVGTFHDGTYTGSWQVSGSSGVWAEPSALPAPTVFAAEEGPVTLGGKRAENKPVFKIKNNGSVSCSGHTLAGESATAASEGVALAASYSDCKWFGQDATFSMGGCGYVLHVSGGFDIVGATCASNPITVSIPGCTATIGPQGSSGLTYVNGGSGKLRSVTAAGEANGLTSTTKGPACIIPGTVSGSIYQSSDILTATTSTGGPQGVSVE